MPDPDYAALSANPRQLLTWLENNLLLAGYLQNTDNPNGTAFCTFTPPQAHARTPAANSAGQQLDAYAVRSYGVFAGDALRAYICNYHAGQVHSVQLGADANFCFTVTLNGCTFGVGKATGDGSVRVSHANTGGNTQAQRDQTFGELGGNVNIATMLEPAMYRRIGAPMNLNATVFGIRDAGAWKFHFQLYSVAGGQYTLHGVFPFPA